ncbi:MAG: TRAP transporter large permease subunit [Alphaproteobacteria bacterium]|nr:TRAP transporter large permease subunit [Alphaproteobacteria bacterium]
MDPVVLGEILAVCLFAGIVACLMLGFPVAFTLAGVALIFAFLGNSLGVFDYALLRGLPSRFFGTMVNEVLVAVPLFVFMGMVLEKSGIAERLLTTMGQLFGKLRGGLAISVVAVGAMLAASTGVVGATVVTMGLLSLPAMMRAGYDPKLATGAICASGTLGQIVPPSVVLIFLADILQGANTAAQAARGNYAPDTVSVGDLFAGGLLPGLLLVCLYIVWIVYKAITDPKSCPPVPMSDAERAGLWRRVVIALIPPILLIVAVLGSILAGVATPTESASVGSLGALLLTLVKLITERLGRKIGEAELERDLFWFWLGFILLLIGLGAFLGAVGLLTGLLVGVVVAATWVAAVGETRREFAGMLAGATRGTLTISSMVFVILLGASVFSLVFRGLGGEHLVERALSDMPGGAIGALVVVMLVMFLLGFILDTFEIIFITVPIAGTVLLKMGIDPIWLGVLIGVNLQTSFLTPPFGFALFYLRGVAPKSITTQHVYRGIVPFVAMQIVALFILYAEPRIGTYLPNLIYRSAPEVPEGERKPDDFTPGAESEGYGSDKDDD